MLFIATMARIIISILLILFSFQSHSQIAMFHAHNFTQPALLLDQYPITEGGAWSLRKLRTAYTGFAIQVRRSSDNTTQDIGFTANNDLDTSALKSFVGAGSGFISIWYDQSGEDIQMRQANTATQPRIVNAGVVERQGTRPSVFFDGSDDFLQANATDTINIVNKDWSTYLVQKRRTGGVRGAILTSAGAGNILQTQWTDNNIYIQVVANNGTNGANFRSAADATSTFSLIEAYSVSNSSSAYKNNTAYSLSSATNFTTTERTIRNFGRYLNGYTDGYISEIVHWNTNHTSNRSAIVSNINTYYTIY